MGFFGWMFWFAAFLFVMSMLRRGCGRRREPRERPGELDQQRSYIESLESRLEYLEERLDFTERLLGSRPAGTPRQS